MATTPQPLVWDFYREVSSAGNTGSVIHYYDEEYQSLYLHSGLASKVSKAELGHWEQSTQGSEDILQTYSYNVSAFDHPANGTVYGTAIDPSDNTLYFLMYEYYKEISNFVSDGSWTMQVDNAINQLDLSVINADADWFTKNTTLFQPGGRIELGFSFGDSASYPIGIAWIDDVEYDILSDTVSVSGRNSIGFFLNDQTFDDRTEFSGSVSSVVEEVLKFFGLESYEIQTTGIGGTYTVQAGDTLSSIAEAHETTVDAIVSANNLTESGTTTYVVKSGDTLGSIATRFSTTIAALVQRNNITNPDLILVGQVINIDGSAAIIETGQVLLIPNTNLELEPSDTGMDGIEKLAEQLSDDLSEDKHWAIEETPDGTIVAGYEAFRADYLPKGNYIFDGDHEVFKRSTTKCVDGAYTHVYVTGTSPQTENDERTDEERKLNPIYLEVPTWSYWKLGNKRTYHDNLDNTTQETLQSYAQDLVKKLQYVGYSESFTGPIRPHLLVGDIASVQYSGESQATSLGIITEVTHHFGKKGFSTDFTLDSGGDSNSSGSYIYTNSKNIYGNTRKKRVTDFIRQLK